MTVTADSVTDRRTATADPPPTGIPNPIHDDDGADGAGYAGALVAGVRTYGWAAQTIARALGRQWLTDGWADVSLRRPLYVGEEITITVERADDRPDAEPAARVAVVARGRDRGRDRARTVLDGFAGLGAAPWLTELDPPPPAAGAEPPSVRPTYDLDSAPLGEPLRPLTVSVSAEAARRLAADDLGIDDARYLTGDRPALHPYFLAARMSPLTRHNFTYGPTIHVRTQIQHRGEARAESEVTIGARIVDVYERNDHWYQVLDGAVSTSADGEVARLRHHTIFRPRGTTLPEPISGNP